MHDAQNFHRWNMHDAQNSGLQPLRAAMRSKRKSPQRLGSVLERCRAMPAFAFPPSAMMPKWKSPCNGLGADKIPEFKKQD